MRILLIDNHDSFTYNLLHLVKSVCGKADSVKVCLSDKLTVAMASDFDRIIISPGPGIPADVKILRYILAAYEKHGSILGVCLGHQAIAEYYGATVYNMGKPVHGVQSTITVTDHSKLFRGVNKEFMGGRYHSWSILNENLPSCLRITAIDEDGGIMALSHREYDVHGVQFHPESFMTACGKAIMANFLNGER